MGKNPCPKWVLAFPAVICDFGSCDLGVLSKRMLQNLFELKKPTPAFACTEDDKHKLRRISCLPTYYEIHMYVKELLYIFKLSI